MAWFCVGRVCQRKLVFLVDINCRATATSTIPRGKLVEPYDVPETERSTPSVRFLLIADHIYRRVQEFITHSSVARTT